MSSLKVFFRTYWDLVIVLSFGAALAAAIYFFWPNREPNGCLDDQGLLVDCRSNDANGNPLNRIPTVCLDENKAAVSCDYHNARDFISSLGLPLGAAFSWLIYFFVGEPRRFNKMLFKNDDISAILPMSGRNLRKNSILMLGLGRCGKTELVKTLSYGSVKTEDNITEKWALYGFGVESYDLTNKSSIKHMLFVNDYRGQKGGQVTEELTRAEKQISGYSGSSINSVILMVDLFPWEEAGDEDKKYQSFSDARIKEHLTEWPRNALDGYFGFLRKGNLKQVFLFINKIDQLENGTGHENAIKDAKEAFKVIYDDLEKRAKVNGAEFRCIVGSVRTGQGVLGNGSLVEALVKHSIEINARTVGVSD